MTQALQPGGGCTCPSDWPVSWPDGALVIVSTEVDTAAAAAAVCASCPDGVAGCLIDRASPGVWPSSPSEPLLSSNTSLNASSFRDLITEERGRCTRNRSFGSFSFESAVA